MYERRRKVQMASVVLFGALCALRAHGDVVPYLTVDVQGAGVSTLYPTDDSFFRENEPNANFNDRTDLNVRSWDGAGTSDNYDCDSLIKFDLSSITPGSQINAATLNLFYENYQMSYPDNRVHTCYRITSDWNEADLTYNNRPSHDATATTSTPLPPAPGVWVTFDVTSDVQLYADGGVYYGWEISDDGTWNSANIPDPWYSSKEAAEPVPGTSTWGLVVMILLVLSAGTVVLMRRRNRINRSLG